ncbi:peroxiredoxin [uncultured Aquimarina sp.]|uniref:peroxiredoxin family protein n=1 Tax=uncultured Aquimarina sp. TaxID=575652 RepID=UPI00261A2821|nr:redoxin domain-containing protein [uncultured Aquimarina sp.]
MKKLKEGDTVDLFVATDINRNEIRLRSFKDKKLYMVFFRKATCPFCNMGLQELIKKHTEFKDKGIEIIAIFASSREEILKYAGKQKPPFPIIPDQHYQIYMRYGIDISYKGMLKTSFNPKKVFKAMTGGFFSIKSTFQDPVMPADFLLDEDQKVKKAYYGTTYDDHLLVSEVLNWV